MGDISKNFNRDEFMCQCGCGMDTVDVELIAVLEDVRERFKSPIVITSGNRCVSHNKQEGGSDNSQHLKSKAADFIVLKQDQEIVADYLCSKYPDKYGIGRYGNRTHIDVRKQKARWRVE